MTTVFRVQDADGRGPFKPGFSSQWVIERPDHENMKPWFVEFGRVDLEVLSGCVSGSACRTPDQLRRWFTKKEYRWLKKNGYQAVKIEVDRVIAESEIQCFVSRSIPFNKLVTPVKLY